MAAETSSLVTASSSGESGANLVSGVNPMSHCYDRNSPSLSFEGIEYEIVEHRLTAEQIRIYDAYADAFQIIHKNLPISPRLSNALTHSSIRGQCI